MKLKEVIKKSKEEFEKEFNERLKRVKNLADIKALEKDVQNTQEFHAEIVGKRRGYTAYSFSNWSRWGRHGKHEDKTVCEYLYADSKSTGSSKYGNLHKALKVTVREF